MESELCRSNLSQCGNKRLLILKQFTEIFPNVATKEPYKNLEVRFPRRPNTVIKKTISGIPCSSVVGVKLLMFRFFLGVSVMNNLVEGSFFTVKALVLANISAILPSNDENVIYAPACVTMSLCVCIPETVAI